MRRLLGIGLVLAAIAGVALFIVMSPKDTTSGDTPAQSGQTASSPPTDEPTPTGPGQATTPPEPPAEFPDKEPEEPETGDIPQDRHPDATVTPSAFAPRDEVTDADLQRALEHQYSGPQPASPHDREAIRIAWQDQRQDISSSMVWSEPRRRAAIAILDGPNADPSNPVAVTVTITWSALDRAGEKVLKRSSIDLTRSTTTGQWAIHH